jgi:hypothetical protein
MVKNTIEAEVEIEEKPTTPEDEIAFLKAKLAAAEAKNEAIVKEIDVLKKKEEGWLIWTDNPLYNGTTAGILFTDGMAFIPENRVIPRFVYEMPPQNQLDSMLEDKVRHPHGDREYASVIEAAKVPSSKRAMLFLTGDFGYHSQYFTKDQQDELQKRISDRARERMEAIERLSKETENMDKLLTSHRL